MFLKRILVLFLLVVFVHSAYAQVSIEIPVDAFSENYAENVEVSGSILASSSVKGSLKFVAPEMLFVFVPRPTSTLQIVLSSIDGKYSADASIELSEDQVGWVQLKVPTKYQSEFIKYLPNRLVAFVFVDSQDMFGNYVQEVYPTSWGEPVENQIKLFVNTSGGNPNITYKIASGDVVSRDCAALDDKYTRVYNHWCEFGSDDIASNLIVTISPEYDSLGKNYVIWTPDEQ
jgi:hypothetical protein